MTQKNGRFYNSKLIAYHSIDPAVMARVADGIHTDLKNGRKLKRTYNGYRPETFLLMVTDYMNGPIRYLKVRGPQILVLRAHSMVTSQGPNTGNLQPMSTGT